MAIPDPLRAIFASWKGWTVTAILVAAFFAQLLNLGWWGLGLMAAAGGAAFAIDLWRDNTTKAKRIAELESDLHESEAVAGAAEDEAARLRAEAVSSEGLLSEVARLRSELAAGFLTLQRLIGGLTSHKEVIDTIKRQRTLRDLGINELLAVSVYAAEEAVLVSAHAPYGGDAWASEPATLLDRNSNVLANGAVVSVAGSQVTAQFPLTQTHHLIREALAETGTLDPDGLRLVPWGLTLEPYNALSDEALDDVGDALIDCADSIAMALLEPATFAEDNEEAMEHEAQAAAEEEIS